MRAHVPGDLEVVATGVGVLGQRGGVRHLGLLVVGVHQRPLAAVHLGRRGPDPRRGDRQQQVGDRGRLAEPGGDHLAHHPEPAGAGDHPGVRDQVAGDDPQQGGLAGAVGADQRDLGALADPERHVVEQHPPVRQLVAHPGDIHVTHEDGFSATRRGRVIPFIGGRYGNPGPVHRELTRSLVTVETCPAPGRDPDPRSHDDPRPHHQPPPHQRGASNDPGRRRHRLAGRDRRLRHRRPEHRRSRRSGTPTGTTSGNGQHQSSTRSGQGTTTLQQGSTTTPSHVTSSGS